MLFGISYMKVELSISVVPPLYTVTWLASNGPEVRKHDDFYKDSVHIAI